MVSCQTRLIVNVAARCYVGMTGKRGGVCSGVKRCGHGQVCVDDDEGQPRCICPYCSTHMDPVDFQLSLLSSVLYIHCDFKKTRHYTQVRNHVSDRSFLISLETRNFFFKFQRSVRGGHYTALSYDVIHDVFVFGNCPV